MSLSFLGVAFHMIICPSPLSGATRSLRGAVGKVNHNLFFQIPDIRKNKKQHPFGKVLLKGCFAVMQGCIIIVWRRFIRSTSSLSPQTDCSRRIASVRVPAYAYSPPHRPCLHLRPHGVC